MEARSRDGVEWTKAGVALAPRDDPEAWDGGGVGSPHVLR
jgi:sucrose-6-phosphate hydrolase SacC (GH32 family)